MNKTKTFLTWKQLPWRRLIFFQLEPKKILQFNNSFILHWLPSHLININNIFWSPYYKYTLLIFCSPVLQHIPHNLAFLDIWPGYSPGCKCDRSVYPWHTSIPTPHMIWGCTWWWVPQVSEMDCNRRVCSRPTDLASNWE